MRINSISIQNFRSIDLSNLSFDSDITIICGENNAGKTTLLEAIYLSSNLKSFKSVSNSELINNHIKKIEIKNKYKDLFNKRKITSILNFMKSDKKNKSDSINLILIRNFGKLNLNYQAKSGELNKFLLKELNKAYL